MGYVDGNLIPGERVIYRTRLHWWVYSKAGFVVLFVLFLIGVAASGGGTALPAVVFLLVLGAILGGSLALWAYIKTNTCEFAVTNKRIIVKVGVVSTRSIDIDLRKVEGIVVNQEFDGKLLGFGTIVIMGTGGTKEPFDDIDDPFEFRRQAQQEVARATATAADIAS